MKFDEIDPEILHPNPWNTNIVNPANEAKLEQSIDRLGLDLPIIVRTLENGRLQILDGEHRVEIAIRKGIKVPIINLGTVDDKRAKEIGLVANERYGTDDTLKLAELLADLGTQDDLASFLPYSDAELSAIFTSTSIDLDDLDLPDDDDDPVLGDLSSGLTVQTHQIMRQKVPVEDAAHVTETIDFIIKTQGFDSSDSMTNAGDALVFMAKCFKDHIANQATKKV